MAIDLKNPDAFKGAEAALKILIKAKQGPIIVGGGPGGGGHLIPPPNIQVEGPTEGGDEPNGPEEPNGGNGDTPTKATKTTDTGSGAGHDDGPAGEEAQEKENQETMKGIKDDQKAKEEKTAAEQKAAFDALTATSHTGDFEEFTSDLFLAISQQIHEVEKYEDGYSRGINPSYAGTGALMPKELRQEKKDIPNIYVYFDISGSCKPYVQKGLDALGALKPFVDRKKLAKPVVKAFANRLGDITVNENGGISYPAVGSGTAGFHFVLEDIEDSLNKSGNAKIKNVIVISDSDIDYLGSWDYTKQIEVSGHVFWLWCNGNAATYPQKCLKGARGSTFYNI